MTYDKLIHISINNYWSPTRAINCNNGMWQTTRRWCWGENQIVFLYLQAGWHQSDISKHLKGGRVQIWSLGARLERSLKNWMKRLSSKLYGQSVRLVLRAGIRGLQVNLSLPLTCLLPWLPVPRDKMRQAWRAHCWYRTAWSLLGHSQAGPDPDNLDIN